MIAVGGTPDEDGRVPVAERVVGAYLDRFLLGGLRRPRLAAAFLRVSHLHGSPRELLAPRRALRVATVLARERCTPHAHCAAHSRRSSRRRPHRLDRRCPMKAYYCECGQPLTLVFGRSSRHPSAVSDAAVERLVSAALERHLPHCSHERHRTGLLTRPGRCAHHRHRTVPDQRLRRSGAVPRALPGHTGRPAGSPGPI